ncbi:DUF4865 family protein [Streptomyces lavendulae]|uniref:DUF4865 domain-containing protein n=2 Tax=Streptomycetaceae TaxID=2062 RepID=A0A068L897_KITAU|nr:DUF4865 family protein [Streptomyces lavendulae]AIE41967.1 hypothetical protein [Streptomyces lavendulae subsp. lavendulae]ATZ29723.1 hypothetical protein SLAV_39800 [Streptomyces lavendulae subsp. lavendulae]
MYAKQYEITLPADYDMKIIRQRVAAGGHVLDDRAGLGLKAYLIRERGTDNSPVNQYAPFYLWNDTGAMAHFLVGGGGFQNIIRDFGRPAALHWTGIACHAGPARTALPRAASRRVTPLPYDADLDGTGLGTSRLIEREAEQLRQLSCHSGVHTAVLAVDPHHWQLLRFVLWEDTSVPDQSATEHYEVLHLSAPGLADLPEGRALASPRR